MNTQVEVFWFVMLCSVVVGYQHFGDHPKDGGSMALLNVGILPQHYTASQARRPRLEYSYKFVFSREFFTQNFRFCSLNEGLSYVLQLFFIYILFRLILFPTYERSI
jgi:hypothetical protein